MDQTLVNCLLAALFALNLTAVKVIWSMVVARLDDIGKELRKVEAEIKKDINGIAANRVTKAECEGFRTLHDERAESIRRDISNLNNQGSKEHTALNGTLSKINESLKELEKCVTLLGAGKDC